MPIKNKMFKRSASFALFRDAPAGASTTLTAAVVKGATTVTLTSGTGFTTNKSFRLGAGEEIERCEVASIAGAVVTLAKPLARAHPAAEPAVEQVGYNLGDTTGGLELAQAMESTDVLSDQRRLVFNRLPGYATYTAATSLLGFTLYALCAALGIPFTRVTGLKTLASPLHLATDFNDVDSVDNQCVVATHVLQDGTVRTQELWGVAVDYTQLSVQLATGQAGAVPIRLSVVGMGVEYDGAPLFVASTTYRATKSAVFGRISAFGVYAAATTGAFASTLATAAAADAAVLDCTSASGIAAEDLVAVSTDDTVEVHWVASKATNAVTIKGKLLRAQAAGTAVTRLQKVPLAVTRDGVTLAIGGTTTPIGVAHLQLPAGYTPGTVDASVTAQLAELSLQNRARALGIPESAIANNRLITTELVGTSPVLAIYLEGVLADGMTVNIMNLWGCAQDLANVLTRFGGQEVASYPFVGKPASGMQFYQYAT